MFIRAIEAAGCKVFTVTANKVANWLKTGHSNLTLLDTHMVNTASFWRHRGPAGAGNMSEPGDATMRKTIMGAAIACSILASAPAWAVTVYGIDLSGRD